MTFSDEDGSEAYLGRFDGQDWTMHTTQGDEQLDIGLSSAVDPDGTAWFTSIENTLGLPRDVVAFDGRSWTRYLEDFWLSDLAVAPDGTAWVTTIPGFDEDGRLFAIRP